MKKLVIFAEGSFELHLLNELKIGKLPFLKELVSNRMNLTTGTRYSFEILEYSIEVRSKLDKLYDVMNFLNQSTKIESTMKKY